MTKIICDKKDCIRIRKNLECKDKVIFINDLGECINYYPKSDYKLKLSTKANK